jgi:hypothetical protein
MGIFSTLCHGSAGVVHNEREDVTDSLKRYDYGVETASS